MTLNLAAIWRRILAGVGIGDAIEPPAGTDEITVLYSGVRGFTTMAESLAPKQAAALVHDYLTSMARIVLQHGGTIDTFAEDAFVAHFGARAGRNDHPERACAAALAMKSSLAELNHDFVARGLPAIAAGVGLDTGPTEVEAMASRLGGLTEVYGVVMLVGESTESRARRRFAFRELDTVRLRGEKDVVRIFEVYGERSVLSADKGFLLMFADALSAYREREFDRAHDMFSQGERLRPGDGPCRLYLARCAALVATPPEASWDAISEE